MKKFTPPPESKSIPSLIISFDRGLDAFPSIFPNGGSEESDKRLMEWVPKNLLKWNERKAGA